MRNALDLVLVICCNAIFLVACGGGGGPNSSAGTSTVASVACASAPSATVVVNVKDLGAKGDGVTDDTAAIQAAVDQVTGTGGTVFVPDGTYMINAPTSVHLKNNVTFRMSGGTALQVIANNAADYNVLSIGARAVGPASNVNVIGRTLIGDRATHVVAPGSPAGEHGMGIGVYSATNVAVQGVTSKDMWGDGFYVGAPASAIAPAANVQLCSVRADNNRCQGMSITNANGVVVQDSVFQNTHGTVPESGLDIEPNQGNTVNHVQVLRSRFLNNSGRGIVVSSGGSGIGQALTMNVTLDGNTVSGNGADSQVSGGILVSYTSGHRITNNAVTGTIGDGMDLLGNSANNIVTGNTVTGSSGWGILLDTAAGSPGLATGNTIADNIVTCNTAGAIRDNVGGNTISGNNTNGTCP